MLILRVRFFLLAILHAVILIDLSVAFLKSEPFRSSLPTTTRTSIGIREIHRDLVVSRSTSSLLATRYSESFQSLRNLFHISSIVFFVCLSFPNFSHAKDVETLPIYRSGKNPEVLSNSKKDSKVGTKKDINFLRCMSNCKAQCQLPGEGLVKTDCVQDCQDQCCDSYEQCSFKIKINTGNTI